MTKLTTHVLDVYSGKPGKGLKVELYYISNNKRNKINTFILNNNGRTDEPLVEIETDKITVEVPAPSAGVLTEIKVQAGKDVNIGGVLGIIGGVAPTASQVEHDQGAESEDCQ